MAKERKVITETGDILPEVVATELPSGREPACAAEAAPAWRRPVTLEEPPSSLRLVRLSHFQCTRAEIEASIRHHETVLTTVIRTLGPPSDGAILTIINTIEALKRLEPID